MGLVVLGGGGGRRARQRTGEIGVIDLHVPQAGGVENFQLLAICRGDVGEILPIAPVHILWVRLALTVAHVVPFGRREGEFDFTPAFARQQRFHVFELREVGRGAGVADLAGADDRFGGFSFVFDEGRDVGHVAAEDGDGRVVDFFHPVEGGEEGACLL